MTQEPPEEEAQSQSRGIDAAVSGLESEIARLEKLRKVREQDLASHQAKLKHKLFADLIKQNLGLLSRGQGTKVLSGFDELGNQVEVEVPLESKLAPKGNMDKHYRLYQKGVKGVTKAGAKLAETETQLGDLRKLSADLLAALESGEVLLIEEVLAALDAIGGDTNGKALTQKRKEAKPIVKGPFDDLPSALRPRVYESVDGWTILVGKGARGNDWLTTRIANGNDWFLHIASFPGAHVIVRNQKGQTPPLETLLDAAQLCLHYSKMKKALAASVHYVQAKFVRKPKGAKPGLVLVHGGKEISIRKDDERLARLLKRDHF